MYEQLRDPNPKVAIRATNYFAKMDRPDIVVTALEHPNLEVKANAAAALESASAAQLKPLASALADALERHNVAMRGGSETQTPLERVRQSLVGALSKVVGIDPSTVNAASPDDVRRLIASGRAVK